MESIDLPGYFSLFSVECHKTRTIDYSQNTVDGLQYMQFNNSICIYLLIKAVDFS